MRRPTLVPFQGKAPELPIPDSAKPQERRCLTGHCGPARGAAEPSPHLVLARRAEHPLFRKVEVYSARNVLHAFRLTSPAEVDDAFAALVAEAYAVGRQEHLRH